MDQAPDLKDQIYKAALIISEGLGLELVDLTMNVYNDTRSIQVLVDLHGGGIGFDLCSKMNHRLDNVLFNDLNLGNNYTLEVSSPGLDRPLKKFSDFRRSLARDVHLFLSLPVNEKIEYIGTICAVRETEVIITTKMGEVLIPIDHIKIGKILIT